MLSTQPSAKVLECYADTMNELAETPEKEPSYGIVELFPRQGDWTEAEYLRLTASTNHLVELSDGRLDFLPMPSEYHQRIVAYLFFKLYAFVTEHNLGTALMAPLKIKLWEGKFREPDIMFMRNENADQRGEQFWQGADFVVEVVSPDAPKRDTVDKFQEYAKAGIVEYWLVDPRDDSLTVYTLPEGDAAYRQLGRLTDGEACSEVLKGFCVDVTALFAA